MEGTCRRAFEHSSAAFLGGDALDARTQGPIKGCHSDALLQIMAKRRGRHVGLNRRLEVLRSAAATGPAGSNSRKCGSPNRRDKCADVRSEAHNG